MYQQATHCTDRSSTATVPANYLGAASRSAQTQQQTAKCQQATRLPHGHRHQKTCTSRLPWAADRSEHWQQTVMYQQATLGCLRVAQAQQRAMYQQATLELPHTGRSSTAAMVCTSQALRLPHTVAQTGNRLCTTLNCLTRVAQAQQQAMYQQAYCLVQLSSLNNRAMYQQATLGCLTRVAQAQQQAVLRQTLDCLTRSLKHSNRLCGRLPAQLPHTGQLAQQAGLRLPADYTAAPLNPRQTATGYVPTKLFPASHRLSSSTATGVPGAASLGRSTATGDCQHCLTQDRSSTTQQTMYQPITFDCPTPDRRHSNRLC
jgi:hypothetical protein